MHKGQRSRELIAEAFEELDELGDGSPTVVASRDAPVWSDEAAAYAELEVRVSHERTLELMFPADSFRRPFHDITQEIW